MRGGSAARGGSPRLAPRRRRRGAHPRLSALSEKSLVEAPIDHLVMRGGEEIAVQHFAALDSRGPFDPGEIDGLCRDRADFCENLRTRQLSFYVVSLLSRPKRVWRLLDNLVMGPGGPRRWTSSCTTGRSE